jgi:hypothetical protein
MKKYRTPGDIMFDEINNNPGEQLHFFGVRVPKNVLQKFHHAVQLYGKNKQRCTEEALEIFSNMVIAEHHQNGNAKFRLKV